MSDPSHHGPAEASAGHEHHYLGIPADASGPDEPRTPGWLTLLGVVLVLGVLFTLALRGPEDDAKVVPGAAPSASAPTEAAAAPPAQVRPAPAMPVPNRPGAAPGGPAPGVPAMKAFPRVPRQPGTPRPGGPRGAPPRAPQN